MNLPKTRAAAIASGATHYFTGKPCRAGHTEVRNLRGECAGCNVAREKRRWAEQRSDMQRKQRRWREANPDYAKQRHKAMVEEAAGRPRTARCECCGKRPGSRKSLVFDHCHDTGAFRGWLCDACNLGIGKLGDTLTAARAAVAYLERAEKERKK